MLAAVGVCTVALGGMVLFPPTPRLLWNATASAPIGLYWIIPGPHVMSGDLVVARLPENVRALAARRGYLSSHVPLLKRVVATEGDTVCADASAVIVDGRRVAVRRAFDGLGRVMPSWSGCWTLGRSDLFLLMSAHPASFDGRYFGVTGPQDVVGEAVPLWTR